MREQLDTSDSITNVHSEVRLEPNGLYSYRGTTLL